MSCTLLDVIEGIAPMYGEKGICPDTPSAVAKIIAELNQLLPMLLKRMDSKGTIKVWKEHVYAGCFCLPPDCLEVRQAILSGTALEQRDEWFEGNAGNPVTGRACVGSALIDQGDGLAIPYPWPPHFDARYAVLCEHNADVGKQHQVVLTNRYGVEVTEFLTYLPDMQLAITASEVTDIKFQKKPITQGAVRSYIWYPQTQRSRLLTSYAPRVTIPQYHQKKLPFVCDCGTLLIKGKIRFRQITSEFDVLPICDVAALGWGFQAMAAFRRGDNAAYNANMAFALNELEKEMRDANSPGLVSQMQFKSPFGRRAFARCWS